MLPSLATILQLCAGDPLRVRQGTLRGGARSYIRRARSLDARHEGFRGPHGCFVAAPGSFVTRHEAPPRDTKARVDGTSASRPGEAAFRAHTRPRLSRSGASEPIFGVWLEPAMVLCAYARRLGGSTEHVSPALPRATRPIATLRGRQSGARGSCSPWTEWVR